MPEIWEPEASDIELLTNYDKAAAQTPFCSFVLARSVWVAEAEIISFPESLSLDSLSLQLPFSGSFCLLV